MLVAGNGGVARVPLPDTLRGDPDPAQRIAVGVDEAPDDRAGTKQPEIVSVDDLSVGE